jgi:hypothetical protein
VSRHTTIHCDRCGSCNIVASSVVELKVFAGDLRRHLPGQVDLCSDCGTALVNFIRNGRQTHQDAPGRARRTASV